MTEIKKLSDEKLKQEIKDNGNYIKMYAIIFFASIFLMFFGAFQIKYYNNYWLFGLSIFLFFESLIYLIGFNNTKEILINRLEIRNLKSQVTATYYTNLIIEKKVDDLNTKYYKIDERLIKNKK